MLMERKRLCAVCLTLVLALTGCTVGPNYKRPKVEIPADYRAATVARDQAPLVDTKWWDLFKDPQLDALIRLALDQNKDLRMTVARVDEARAQLGIVGAGRYPQVGAGASATATLGSETGARPVPSGEDRTAELFRVGFTFAWEMDLWGKYRRATEAARAQLLATEEVRQAKNQQDIAALDVNSTIDGEHSSVVQVKAKLSDAEWKLNESTVYAPANGFIPDVQLKEGYIAGLNQSVLSLVSTDDWWIYGLFEQSRLGLVEPGDDVEMVFRFYPGRAFRGKVEYIIRAVGQGQLPSNGMVTPVTPSETDLQLFSVKVELDEESRKALPLNLGATGEMVIFTKHVRAFHIIGRIVLRMDMWKYYLGL